MIPGTSEATGSARKLGGSVSGIRSSSPWWKSAASESEPFFARAERSAGPKEVPGTSAAAALDETKVRPYIGGMATAMIKSTYSLDLETARLLDEMAREWEVSKSEALRRAIRASAGQAPSGQGAALEALDRLQDTLHLSSEAAEDWSRSVQSERRAFRAGQDQRVK